MKAFVEESGLKRWRRVMGRGPSGAKTHLFLRLNVGAEAPTHKSAATRKLKRFFRQIVKFGGREKRVSAAILAATDFAGLGYTS